eukprot:UN34707
MNSNVLKASQKRNFPRNPFMKQSKEEAAKKFGKAVELFQKQGSNVKPTKKRPKRKKRLPDTFEAGIDFSFLPTQQNWDLIEFETHYDAGKVPDCKLPYLFTEKTRSVIENFFTKVKEMLDRQTFTSAVKPTPKNDVQAADAKPEPPPEEIDTTPKPVPLWARTNVK